MMLKDVTFGVSSLVNTKALLMCLSSVLNASRWPAAIQIRFEGQLPSFAEFYLEQLAELARLKGVEWTMCVAKSEGIRVARDWQVDHCRTKYLWMGDDDALYDYDCLEYFQVALEKNLTLKFAYLCGSKADVNNRRGYKNFQTKEYGPADVYDNCAFNWLYHKADCAGMLAKIYTADTGNMLINVPSIREHAIKFKVFDFSTNSGGEDTIFALECGKAGLDAFIVPSARAYHLEKPVINFDEFNARGEMVLRAAQIRGYSGEQMDYVRKSFMPWLNYH